MKIQVNCPNINKDSNVNLLANLIAMTMKYLVGIYGGVYHSKAQDPLGVTEEVNNNRLQGLTSLRHFEKNPVALLIQKVTKGYLDVLVV